jgi:DNA modification methylase
MNSSDIELIHADARHLPLEDESVQCIVTSPPYWGLRKYAGEQESVWGGFPKIDPGSLKAIPCDHAWTATATATEKTGGLNGLGYEKNRFVTDIAASTCQKCGAWRGAYGLEPTIEMYVAHTVEILRELRRVLRPDGVLFWNIGDSYATCRGNTYGKPVIGHSKIVDGLKPKDLCLIPSRVAIAAQADGWWVRSLIIWAKPNPMPESCTDRPMDAYEHIIMLTKSERYFWDADAVREPHSRDWTNAGGSFWHPVPVEDHGIKGYAHSGPPPEPNPLGRNIRNVWTFPTQPFSGAHFATFPEEIPRRCIMAATSARGACTQCGAPWERVVRASGGTIGEAWHDHSNDLGQGQRDESGGKSTDGTYRRDTIGWHPTCECRGQHGKTRPCLVLDPFAGSGTTGRVARALRRHAVLADVAYGEKDEYRKLAEARISNVDVELPFL